ncbi:MAG: hypothetical protein R3241_06100, partial [Rheinheimera sp.]|nr:hypothetical protein [Rheinheimera sp.]
MIRNIVLGFALLWCANLMAASNRQVVVGVYPNAPKIDAAEDGSPSGILGELLLEIAKDQPWQI